MATSTLSKTAGTTLLSRQALSAGSMIIGSAVDVSTLFAARVTITALRTSTTALSNQLRFVLEGSAAASGDEQWFSIYEFLSSKLTTTGVTSTVDAFYAAGSNPIGVASSTGFSAGDLIFVNDGNAEIMQLKSVTTSVLTLYGVTARSHNTGANVYSGCERVSWTEDLRAIKRIRLIVDGITNGTSGTSVTVEAFLNTLDSVQTA